MTTKRFDDTGSQNPYAVLSLTDEESVRAFKRKIPLEHPREMELPLLYAPVSKKSAAVDYSKAPSGNPYATLAMCDEDPVDLFLRRKSTAGQRSADDVKVPKGEGVGISKKAFQEGCRRILLPYVPRSEGNILRNHYREFISRNEDATPKFRERLLAELAKYDLSVSGNLTPHFNRERELLTVAKLKKIEQAAE
jgi:hypothetical protein